MPDPHDAYWLDYTPVQAAKHLLLRRYLSAWFPILAHHAGEVVYVDSHAGRGRHETGEAGSPLIAVSSLLSHTLRDAILSRCRVSFLFLEQDPGNCAVLRSNVAGLGDLPRGVSVEVVDEDYEAALSRLLARWSARGAGPSFFFIDPFGFDVPMDLLRRILAFRSSELLINFMFKFIDRAVHNDLMVAAVDRLFGCEDWRQLLSIADVGTRHNRMIQLYVSLLGCQYSSVLQMRGKRGGDKYDLIHATNHMRGREEMKEAMWRVTPDGSFAIHEGRDPDQLTLIELEPDLTPLKRELLDAFAGQRVRYDTLCQWLVVRRWRRVQLNEVLRSLREAGEADAEGYSGRFSFGKNPEFVFKSRGEQYGLPI